ncbi:TetR/AcrR family transcriptional regulator [Psychrobacillus sp. BM2]|uniref:TetR/AcrR family transcriptional regulator n=1 Tax=Psychrobacillus sp. BM2 TaxID=3400421 RepID=UPI003B0239B6
MEINTKEKILIAASRLFRRQGYHATTLNQISKESNTPRGSVYYYFENGKEQLAQEAILRTGQIIKQRIENALALESDAANAIYTHLRNIADEIEQQKETTDIFSLVAISREVSDSNAILRKSCEEVYDNWINIFANKIKQSGFSDKEALELAIIIQAMIEGAYALMVSQQNVTAMRIVSEQVLKLLHR